MPAKYELPHNRCMDIRVRQQQNSGLLPQQKSSTETLMGIIKAGVAASNQARFEEGLALRQYQKPFGSDRSR